MSEPIEVKGTNGRVSFDGRVVTIRRSGIWTANLGREERVYPVSRIGTIELRRPALLNQGEFSVRPTGAEPFRGKADKNPDAVIFRPSRRREFEALRDAILAAM